MGTLSDYAAFAKFFCEIKLQIIKCCGFQYVMLLVFLMI